MEVAFDAYFCGADLPDQRRGGCCAAPSDCLTAVPLGTESERAWAKTAAAQLPFCSCGELGHDHQCQVVVLILWSLIVVVRWFW